MVCEPVSIWIFVFEKRAFHSCRGKCSSRMSQVMLGIFVVIIFKIRGSPEMMNHSGSLVWMRVNSTAKLQINAGLDLFWKKKNWCYYHTNGSCDHESNKTVWAASRSPVVVSHSGSGKVTATEIPGLCLACTRTEFQTKRDIIQMLSPALCFWLFSSFLHPNFFSSPLDLFLSEICMRACAEETWGVNSRNQRKPNVRNKRWICSLLSLFCFLPPSCLSLWTSWAWQSLRLKSTKNSVAEVHLNWRQTHRNRRRLRL